MTIDKNRLRFLLEKFKQSKVLVIGDIMLDQFIWGEVSRISPEAPVPVVHLQRESLMPGGAANVACNIGALNGKAGIIGVIGNDHWGKILKALIKRSADTKGIVTDRERQTSLKTRIVARHQQVVRVDREEIKEINKKISQKIINFIKNNLNNINAIIIEDYGKGVINPFLLEQILKAVKRKNFIITVDPKEEHFSYYHGVTCITPNQHEAEKATGINIIDEKSLEMAGRKLLKKIKACAVLITRGEQGMSLFIRGKKTIYIPTQAQEVFDVSGAGDTVIGAFTLALASGATFEEAAHISNYAAGVVVGKVGVGTCTPAELLTRIEQDIN
ncbi:MAG: D-glycero-beta-D-manno-heptose-7-phosphate kinase [Candidatus Omnitrophota bacterium]